MIVIIIVVIIDVVVVIIVVRPGERSCALGSVRLTESSSAPGEHFLTWAVTSSARSSQKLPEKPRTVVSNLRSEDPLEVPDKQQRVRRSTSDSAVISFSHANN